MRVRRQRKDEHGTDGTQRGHDARFLSANQVTFFLDRGLKTSIGLFFRNT